MSNIGEQPPQHPDTQGRTETPRAREARLLTIGEDRPTIGRFMGSQPAGKFDPQAARHLAECVPRAIARVLTVNDGAVLTLAEARDLCAASERPALRELREAALTGRLKTVRVRGKFYTTVQAVRAAFGPPAPGPDDAPSPGEPAQPVPRSSERSALADTPASRPVQVLRT